jgi:hypothetical protein
MHLLLSIPADVGGDLVFLSRVFILLLKADCLLFVLLAEEVLREYSSRQEKSFYLVQIFQI